MTRPLVAVILAFAVLGGVATAAAAQQSSGSLYAYNTQNPRWETERAGDVHQRHKPYKPLRQPPGALPPHRRGSSLVLNQYVLLGLATIFILGVTAEWLSWMLHLPSPLLLLIAGFVAGPATGFLDPDLLLGNLLLPMVSLSLAVILFHQSLNLRRRDPGEIGGTVGSLLSLGVLVAWAIDGIAGRYIVGLPAASAALLGAVLLMSAPAVIGPLVDSIRPRAPVGAALRWEGAGLDLIGTMLAIMVLETVVAGGSRQTAVTGITGILKTAAIAAGAGGLGAAMVMILLARQWVPQRLVSLLALTVVVSAFTLANAIQEESGFLAAIAMGVALAQQRRTGTEALRELHGLPAMLAAPLFVVLAARLDIADVSRLGAASAMFVAVVVLIGRPVAVVLSTSWSGLSRPERVWMSSIAPRGVVVAAIASICGLRLVEVGYPEAERVVPLAFLVISVSAILCGLTASPVAQWLGIARAEPHQEPQPTKPRSSIVALVRGRR